MDDLCSRLLGQRVRKVSAKCPVNLLFGYVHPWDNFMPVIAAGVQPTDICNNIYVMKILWYPVPLMLYYFLYPIPRH